MKMRRGLSTVVGMVFSIIALTTTVAYVSYSMNSLNQYNQAVLTKNQQLGNTANEKFQISSVTIPNSKLNITLANTGNLPINITKIWVQNTSAANWINSYTPSTPKGFVSPGATLTNLGQDIGAYINPTKSYNVKLVTSRGSSQAFTVNSASAAKLNVQLMLLPSTVSAGFHTELVMIVTNNSTGTLTNISPGSYTLTGSAASYCTASSVSPPRVDTLAPGSTAVFKWDVAVGSQAGGTQTCTYTFNTPLQNGYSQSVSATLTVTTVSLTSTTYADNAGLLTIKYTSFQWTTGGSWNNNFGSGLVANHPAYAVTITNNNQTNANIDSFWISKSTIMSFFITPPPNNNVGTADYIVGSVNLNPLTVTAYSPDYLVGIPNGGGQATIYFGATTKQGTVISYITSNDYIAFVSLYGKFSKNPTDSASTYAQNLPFIGLIVG